MRNAFRGLKARPVLAGAVGIVALALVILVSAALSEPRSGVSTRPVADSGANSENDTPDHVSDSERYVRQAEAALASGDESAAIDLLRSAVEADPANVSARRLLTELTVVAVTDDTAEPGTQSGDSSGGSSQSGATDTPPVVPPASSVYDKPVTEMVALLPSSVANYTQASVERGLQEAILALRPTRTGPAIGRVSIAVLTAYDRGSSSAARDFVTGIGKAYPDDRSSVRIGSQTGAFGTDGARLASVAFSRGRFAFEAVLTAEVGVDSATLKSATVGVAAAFPAAK